MLADQNQAESLGYEDASTIQTAKSQQKPCEVNILGDDNDGLPYPDLFDRSERTFCATFSKQGDLTYFTPIQRIGIYMDYSSRMKRRHLNDLIKFLKQM